MANIYDGTPTVDAGDPEWDAFQAMADWDDRQDHALSPETVMFGVLEGFDEATAHVVLQDAHMLAYARRALENSVTDTGELPEGFVERALAEQEAARARSEAVSTPTLDVARSAGVSDLLGKSIAVDDAVMEQLDAWMREQSDDAAWSAVEDFDAARASGYLQLQTQGDDADDGEDESRYLPGEWDRACYPQGFMVLMRVEHEGTLALRIESQEAIDGVRSLRLFFADGQHIDVPEVMFRHGYASVRGVRLPSDGALPLYVGVGRS